MELREQFPTMTEVRQLEYVGFSSEQIAGLFRVKALYQGGVYHESTAEYKRLAFVRWLYRQGRLQSQVGIMAHVRGRMGNGAEPLCRHLPVDNRSRL
jgi:hypothetical protein